MLKGEGFLKSYFDFRKHDLKPFKSKRVLGEVHGKNMTRSQIIML